MNNNRGPNHGGIKRGDSVETGDNDARNSDGVGPDESGVPAGDDGPWDVPTADPSSEAEVPVAGVRDYLLNSLSKDNFPVAAQIVQEGHRSVLQNSRHRSGSAHAQQAGCPTGGGCAGWTR